MPYLHIHLMGDLRKVHDGMLVTAIVQARLQALLAYLLLNRDSPQPRQRLAFLFWPDTTESQARTNLRQLLHHLRRTLSTADQFLQIKTQTVYYQLGAACSLEYKGFNYFMEEQNGHPADHTLWGCSSYP